MSTFRFRSVPAGEAGFSASVLGEMDNYFATMVANGELPGQVLLLARGETLVHTHVTGFADIDAKTPLHADSIFALFSMTKPLTAVAMLLLYDEGKWQLDDPVSIYLPEFKNIASLPGSRATREPTIRETFTHTAGFTMGPSRESMLKTMQQIAWHKAGCLAELIGRYADMPLGYEPGTSWEYGVATDLQAAIVERLTGERFDLFLKRRVFTPLGMHDTAFSLDQAQASRLAPSYMVDLASGRLRRAEDEEQMQSIFPMGGTSFKSTALDFARFARMLLNRGSLGDVAVLKPKTVALMLSDHLPDGLRENRYAAGHHVIGQGNGHALNGLICVDPERAGRPVGKGTYEWGGAFGTWFWIDPEHDLLCVGMTTRRRVITDMRPLEFMTQELVYRALQK